MATKKIVYRTWLAENSSGPSTPPFISLNSPQAGDLTTDHLALSSGEQDRLLLIERAIRAALLQLTVSEQEFIERFYFHAENYKQISATLHRRHTRLVALHERALRRLRKELRPFVHEHCSIDLEPPTACILCSSNHRSQIDRLLADRDRTRPWTTIIRKLRDDFGLHVKNPSLLIGHEKYH